MTSLNVLIWLSCTFYNSENVSLAVPVKVQEAPFALWEMLDPVFLESDSYKGLKVRIRRPQLLQYEPFFFLFFSNLLHVLQLKLSAMLNCQSGPLNHEE